ncbi:hypothetical protein Ddye_015683 [Dipteronia dyeriana]|uniref:Uncharacterized protein n=1 Tax=Dipteronia dyeriana TaxID=168575 RepID=A0AAD9WY50_9ROSI|nr:hypothetical protein Ddye_015683 [Dipteronia dyeriana]
MAEGRKGKQVAKDDGRLSKKRRQAPAMPSVRGKGKEDSITDFPNLSDPESWALFGSMRIWPEKGINMPVFSTIFIPATVNTMGWNRYVRTPNMAALELVKKFYYAMVPYQFLQRVSVMV